ncbi:MAG: carboxymuconolactone decarboxylase family protein [Thermoanaerobaculia bacterium]
MDKQQAPQAFVKIPSAEEMRATPPTGAGYDYGFVPAMRRLLMAHQEIGQVFLPLFRQLMFAPGSLSRRERELVATVASAAQDCHY